MGREEGVVAPALTSSNSSRIIYEAETWLGTPYHEQASVKGPNGGVDCAMFLVRVFVDAGLVKEFDPRPYSNTFYLHSSEPRYLNWVERYGVKLPDGELECPGDIALFKLGRAIGHGAICLGNDMMIHAWKQAGYVTRSELRCNLMLYPRLAGFWRLRDG